MTMEKHKTNHYLWLAGLAGASLLTGCGNSVKQWAKAPGTNGFINMDDVKQAFRKNGRVEDFENRVNKIYEGDHLVLFSARQVQDGFEIVAKEDLDDDKQIGEKDDLLFTLTVKGQVATLKGAGVNRYYTTSWVYTPPEKRQDESHYRSRYGHGPYFHYWYWGRGWRGYYTPASRYTSMRNNRDAYRATSGFHTQVKNNVDYESRMSKKYGSGFRKNATQSSPVRKQYVSSTQKSGGLQTSMKVSKKTSGWGVRSQMGSAGSFAAAKTQATAAKTRSSASSRSSSRSSRGFGGHRGSSGFRV